VLTGYFSLSSNKSLILFRYRYSDNDQPAPRGLFNALILPHPNRFGGFFASIDLALELF